MEMSKLLDFIGTESERLNRVYGNLDSEKVILARTVKLGEEVGELCEAVLSNLSLQWKHKPKVSRDELEKEFADVVITTLLMAHSMDVDVRGALERKIQVIKNRNKGKP
ncbi:MAG: hypothetical protein GOV00_01150 [Candidatus Altiarchaeota archaeon]|nr:hypothetical protein [Candidatus Altiarchaeota archaeon]